MRVSRSFQFAFGILTSLSTLAQTTATPSFEAASIKQNTGPANGTGTVRILPGGRLRAENALVRALIQNAYEVKPFEIVGGPPWIDSARYDIEATAAGEPNDSEAHRMMQALLEERFRLRVHRETRIVPVYTLNAAKNGLKLAAPAEGDCVAPGPIPNPARLPCGRVMARIQMPIARLEGARVGMADLARVLSNLLWKPVIEATGYTAKFDMKVEFAADDAIGILAGPYRPDAALPTPVQPGGVSIFTAFQEQLGLKIESSKGPVEVLLIDRIERPSAN